MQGTTNSDRADREACLFVLPWSLDAVGGVNTVVENLIKQARRSDDFEPLLLVSSWDNVHLRETTTDGYVTAYLRMRSPHVRRSPIKGFLMFLTTLPAVAIRILALLRRHNVAVVNIHYPGTHLLAFTLLRGLGLLPGPMIISVHGSDVLAARRAARLKRLAWKLLLGSADRIVACSAHLRGLVSSSFPTLADRTHVVWNGVDLAELQSGAIPGAVPNELADSEYLLAVGSFEKHKGHDVLARAFAKLQGARRDLRLVIVGRPGPVLPELRRYFSKLGLHDHVHLVESVPRERIGAYYEKAKVCVVPSRREAFGIVALEAGVFRKPVVAASVGGLPEILDDSVSGVLVTPEDPNALARGIQQVLDDPAFAARIGEELYRAVVDRFSWNRVWDQYLGLMVKR